MSGYTVVNLMELPDSVGDRAPGLEGRFGRSRARITRPRHQPLALRARTAAARWATATASRRRPTWSSPAPGGSCSTARCGELAQWDVVRVAPEVMRAFESGPDGLELLAIGGPRPEDGDGEMGEAAWPE